MKKENMHCFAKRAGAVLLASMMLAGPCPVYADADHSEFARASELSTAKEIMKYGMTPISGDFIKDGTWDIEVRSSSGFFRVHSCELVVSKGKMQAKIIMETYSYPLLYMGTGEEAGAAAYEDYIEYEDIDDWYVFTVPVKALNTPIDCASFSKKKKKWYDRKLLFDAGSLPKEALDGFELPDYELIQSAVEEAGISREDLSGENAAASEERKSGSGSGNAANSEERKSGSGSGNATNSEGNTPNSTGGNTTVSGGTADNNPADANLSYSDARYAEPIVVEDMEDGRYSINVALTGGSGRASVSTPTLMIVEDGKAYAELLWSSPNYDWMQVGGVTYLNEAEEGGNSVFTIPIADFDSVIPIIADTTAMGDPVAIQYSLTFYEESIGDEGLIPQIAAKKVVIFAVIIIVVGFFLNLIVKKKRRR